MDHLSKLENQSIFILREAYSSVKNIAMLWSLGKDSNVMVWLAFKAFLGNIPFPSGIVQTPTLESCSGVIPTIVCPAILKSPDVISN